MKKSAIVRNMIANAKENGIGENDVILQVMAEIGFKRQLARAYVKNNWNKVEVAAPAVDAVDDAVDGYDYDEAAPL